jgi:tetratricopeptide (TPR) repeat protein
VGTDVQGSWQRAERLSEVGRHADAEREMRGALAAEPDDPFLHAMLAKYLYLQDKNRAALVEAGEAIRLAPDLDVGYFFRALILLDEGKFKPALEAARRTVELDNESAANLGLLGRCCERLNRWPEALDAAGRGLAVDPADTRCAAVRADALRALGRADEARATLRGQLEDDPEDAETHAGLGWQALRDGDRAEAMVHFREALRLHPEMAVARQGLAAAMQSRSPVYGWFFRFRAWIGDKPAWWPWALLAVGVFAPRAIRAAAPGSVWGAAVAEVVRAAAFVFWYLWAMLPAIGTVLLWSDRDGRRAMNDEQRAAVKWFLPALLLAAAAVIASPLIGRLTMMVLVLPTLVVGFLVTATYSIPAGPRRRRMGVLSAAVVAVAFVPAVARLTLLGYFLIHGSGKPPLWLVLPAGLALLVEQKLLLGVLVVVLFDDTIAKWIAGPEGTRPTIY